MLKQVAALANFMCRLLGYLGRSISLDSLLLQPEHSLVVQSYQPREMTSGLLNADGFGVGWYHPRQQALPFTYRNTLPIWNDLNLPQLSRYIESDCIVASIRSATPGQAVDLSNCQPFTSDRILGIHNGYIDRFRQTLYRPIRQTLDDLSYQSIAGSTDSEHLFALILHLWRKAAQGCLETALYQALEMLKDLAATYQTELSANFVLSDGERLWACRFATRSPAPSLYWLKNHPNFPSSVIVASEPLFPGPWQSFPEGSLLSVQTDLTTQLRSIEG
jgi:ergothioneine biosynthesis protein EgtC